MLLKLLNDLFPSNRYEEYTISTSSFPSWPEWLSDHIINVDHGIYYYGTKYILDKDTGIVVKEEA